MAAPDQVPNLETLCDRVIGILVDTFDFPADEARQRLTLWRSQQHDLTGAALEAMLPAMGPAEKEAALLKWALEGAMIQADLRDGAARLGIDLADQAEPEERPPR